MRLRAIVAGIAGALFSSAPLGDAAAEVGVAESGRLETVLELDPSDEGMARGSGQISTWEALCLSAYAEEVMTGLGAAGVEPLGRLLGSVRHPDRSWLLLSWTLSSREPLRQVVGRTAPYLPHTVGLGWALETLTHDPSPEVRQAAREALGGHAVS